MATIDTERRRFWPLWLSVLLGLVVAFSTILRISKPLDSNDIWWHMALGRHVLDTGSLIVDHSLFTWTPATAYHIYNTWLADIFFYLVHEWSGIVGLVAIKYLIFCLFFLLAWQYAYARGILRNPLTWLLILLGLNFAAIGEIVKPELLTVGFMVLIVWLYFTLRFRGDRAWAAPYLFPLILAVWINVHGGFALSSLFFAAIGIGELLNMRFSPSQAMPGRLRKHFFIALALCIPALVVNPFGYELPLHIVVETLWPSADSLAQITRVQAYRPTAWLNDPPFYLLDYLLLAMLVFVVLIWQKLKARQTDWVVILMFIAYCALYVQYVRAALFLGPVFPFVAMDLLAKKDDSWAWSKSVGARVLLAGLSTVLVATIGWRLVSSFGCNAEDLRRSLASSFTLDVGKTPSAETDFIAQQQPAKRIGNLYGDGGYLMFRMWPERQVMIDPRFFPFEAWFDDYLAFQDGLNTDAFLEAHPADIWLAGYSNVNTFLSLLRSKDWALAFAGPFGGVFVPAQSFREKLVISPEVDGMADLLDIATAFSLAVQLPDLSLAQRLRAVAVRNLAPSCEKHQVILEEMKLTIAGAEAFDRGDFEKAAQLLSGPTRYIQHQSIAADALMVEAGRARELGDLPRARAICMEVLRILPIRLMTDLYNFAVIDWEYRHVSGVERRPEDDALGWRKVSDVILVSEDQLPERYRSVIDTARAMKEGSYAGGAPFVPRDLNFDHGPD